MQEDTRKQEPLTRLCGILQCQRCLEAKGNSAHATVTMPFEMSIAPGSHGDWEVGLCDATTAMDNWG